MQGVGPIQSRYHRYLLGHCSGFCGSPVIVQFRAPKKAVFFWCRVLEADASMWAELLVLSIPGT